MVTIEVRGPTGAGKTTLIELLRRTLIQNGYDKDLVSVHGTEERDYPTRNLDQCLGAIKERREPIVISEVFANDGSLRTYPSKRRADSV